MLAATAVLATAQLVGGTPHAPNRTAGAGTPHRRCTNENILSDPRFGEAVRSRLYLREGYTQFNHGLVAAGLCCHPISRRGVFAARSRAARAC